ncbi:metallophosphoesterase [Streptomyces sp. AS02]|uniref:metallophosphoesterase family protein n=1 Tax=Streptomyces sp. AS02 TaxID=2938946 RepID=UPI00202129BC|nr:metallophosphoesterase [Streptomyces sp. AS02]MCL8012343.1 metallophosphoesterase [Streptomyces sp. AS02]
MVRSSITWWQLSDLHWPVFPEPEREQFITVLLDHLSKAQADSGTPDFVIFTGDVAQSGKAEEYASVARVLFTPLREIVGEKTPLLFVPGNHDMDRDEAAMKASHLVTGLKDPGALDIFLKGARQRENFADPFRNYQEFVREWGPAGTDNVYSWSHDVVVEDRRCRVTGINSAWSGYYHVAESGIDSDRGRLLLSISQIPKLEEDIDYALFAQHHPFDWLHDQISDPAMQQLKSEYQIGLFGHVHSPRALGISQTPNHKLMRVPSMLLFGRPHRDDSAEFVRGYARGELLFDQNRCVIRYFKYDGVHSRQFREHTDVYHKPDQPPVAELQPLRHRSVPASVPPSSGGSFVTLVPRIRHLQSLIAELNDPDRDTAHTLEVFQKLVERIDFQMPLTSYGSRDQVALAYVMAELSIVHGRSGAIMPGAETTGGGPISAALQPLTETTCGVAEEDITDLCRLLDHVSLYEPGRIRRAGDLRRSPAADCFAFLWGLARLAQLLDNPGLMDADAMQAGMYRRNVLDVHERLPADGTLVFDLATRDRLCFHLTAEAQHTVRLYFVELENVRRSWQVMRPPVRFELNTPYWRDRSLRSNELRVDAQPITRLLMGSALYGDRPHVWLRELIQNAVDATQMRASTQSGDYQPRIDVELEDAHWLVIRDNGVGMTYQQVVSQLSVLGRSGWRDSADRTASPDGEGPTLFGRFGIGFASVFSVASSVEVRTRTVDCRPVDGILVQFSTPDRPFYTDNTVCPPGTEIRVQLTVSLTTTAFRDAMADLFAYLPPFVHLSPDLRLPTSLAAFSPLDRKREHLNGWTVQRHHDATHLGPYPVDFHLDVVHDPSPHQRNGDRSGPQPDTREVGRTSATFCVDGVRIMEHTGLNSPGEHLPYGSNGQQHGNLNGCHVTVDFRRDNAPVTASRNALEGDAELHEELMKLVQSTVAGMLPQLVQAAQSGCLNAAAQRRAAFQTLCDLLDGDHSSHYYRGRFHSSPVLSQAAAEVYRDHCPVAVRSAAGRMLHIPLDELDPTRCSVVTTTKLAQHALFPAFCRANDLTEWITALDGRELSLLQEAWPHEVSLRVVASSSQLMEDIQRILPEIRDGHVWQLLRADYALSESQVFGDALVVPLPTRPGTVRRADGVARRRAGAATGERPRKLLNQRHPLVEALERHLSRAAGAGQDELATATDQITSWLDLLCDQVLDEPRITVQRERWKQLVKRLRQITGDDFSQTAADALHPSWKDSVS